MPELYRSNHCSEAQPHKQVRLYKNTISRSIEKATPHLGQDLSLIRMISQLNLPIIRMCLDCNLITIIEAFS
jgi:hypothetical protein